MVERLLKEFEFKVESVTVIPSTGGVFEVMADDQLVYSKKQTGAHADYEDVAAPLRELLPS